MKVGDLYESPGGMTFTITKVTKTEITVNVDRTYRDRNGAMELRQNERVVPVDRFPVFARAYKKVMK